MVRMSREVPCLTGSRAPTICTPKTLIPKGKTRTGTTIRSGPRCGESWPPAVDGSGRGRIAAWVSLPVPASPGQAAVPNPSARRTWPRSRVKSTSSPVEQEKTAKFNALLMNAVIFHNAGVR